jgi:two-component system, LytTR family, response regulator
VQVLENASRIIRAAIVDHETVDRLQLRELLDSEDDIEIVGEYRDVSSASAGIDATHPDLLFIGSSFSALENLAEAVPATIFVASDEGFAARAFDFNTLVDFLLKPLETDRFRRSIARARRYIVDFPPVVLPAPQPPPEPEHLERLAVKTRGKVYILRVDDIDWIETAGNYVRLHAAGKTHLYRDSLVDFESRLDPRRFVRIHRSNIVNIDRIAQLEPSFHREHVVLLRDGTRLTLTAPYRARMRTIIGQF